MDYMELVLRRQHALWGFLLEGRTELEELREQRPQAEEREDDRWEPWAFTQERETAEADFEEQLTAGRQAARSALRENAPDMRRSHPAPDTREPFLSEAARLAAALERRGQAVRTVLGEEPRRAAEAGPGQGISLGRRVASRAAENEETYRQRTWETTSGTEDNGPEAISRLLERDARRYDSGFSLY